MLAKINSFVGNISTQNQVCTAGAKDALNYIASQAAEKKVAKLVADSSQINSEVNSYMQKIDNALSDNENSAQPTYISDKLGQIKLDGIAAINAVPLVNAPVAPADTENSSSTATSSASASNTSSTNENSGSSATSTKDSAESTSDSLPKTFEQVSRSYSPLVALAIAGVGISLLAFQNKKQQH